MILTRCLVSLGTLFGSVCLALALPGPAARLDGDSPMPEGIKGVLLCQGDLPKIALLQQHAGRINQGQTSVIFGLASFAEGVDLPGDLCRHVVIAKLPFAAPGSPVS